MNCTPPASLPPTFSSYLFTSIYIILRKRGIKKRGGCERNPSSIGKIFPIGEGKGA